MVQHENRMLESEDYGKPKRCHRLSYVIENITLLLDQYLLKDSIGFSAYDQVSLAFERYQFNFAEL